MNSEIVVVDYDENGPYGPCEGSGATISPWSPTPSVTCRGFHASGAPWLLSLSLSW